MGLELYMKTRGGGKDHDENMTSGAVCMYVCDDNVMWRTCGL